MPKQMGVSIVIPNYNYEAYVGAAIESALGQSYSATQVIVVDDGSTDGSMDVIQRYRSDVVVVSQENQGNLKARMSGYTQSTNDIIFFLDSDDVLHKEAASKVVSRWGLNVSKVQFALETIDGQGRSFGTIYPKYPKKMSGRRVMESLLATGSYPSPPTSGNAYSRRFVEKLLPILDKAPALAAIDTVANTLAPLHGQIVTINQPLAYYRVHENNISGQSKIERQRFLRFARQEEVRIGILKTHAEHLGIPFDTGVLTNNMAYQHAQLAAEKLARDRSRSSYLREVNLTFNAARSTLKSAFGFWPRVFLAGWIGMVGLSPRGLAANLLAQRYAAQHRSPWIKAIAELFSKKPRITDTT